jgi:Ca2+-binding EF-hand superfamily protein
LPVSLKEAFDVVDADSDSNASTAEYEAARVNMLEGVDFAALDTDEDGVIGIEEV